MRGGASRQRNSTCNGPGVRDNLAAWETKPRGGRTTPKRLAGARTKGKGLEVKG